MVDALNSSQPVAFHQEKTSLGLQHGRLEFSDATGKINAVRVIKVVPGTLLDRILRCSFIQAVVIYLCFGNFAYAHGYLVSVRSFEGSLLQRAILRQLDSSLLTCKKEKTRTLLQQVKQHLEVDKVAFRTLAINKQIIFRSSTLPSQPEFFINCDQNKPELLLATRPLGKGSFKRVVKTYNTSTQEKKAVAIHMPEDLLSWGMAKGEYHAYQTLKKEGITGIIGLDLLKQSQGKEQIGIMRYCKGPEFPTHVDSLPHDRKIALFAKLADTINQIHLHGFVHRDIKVENVFVDKGEVLLGDLGITCRTGKLAFTAGTFSYMPPELHSLLKIVAPVRTTQDAWAFGTLIAYTHSGDDFRIKRVRDGLFQHNPNKRMTLEEAHRILSQ